jgi:hypothetical protein
MRLLWFDGVMLEKRSVHLLSPRQFAVRVARHGAVSAGIVVLSLLLGMAGYHVFEGLGAVDAFLDSAMLLGGMGPVHTPTTTSGKVFAGLYALYAGLVFLVSAGVVAAPIVHRTLHHFHLDESGRK